MPAVKRVRLGAGELHLGELRAAGVVRLGDDARDAGPGLRRAAERRGAVARRLQHRPHRPGTRIGQRARQARRLHRA